MLLILKNTLDIAQNFPIIYEATKKLKHIDGIRTAANLGEATAQPTTETNSHAHILVTYDQLSSVRKIFVNFEIAKIQEKKTNSFDIFNFKHFSLKK